MNEKELVMQIAAGELGVAESPAGSNWVKYNTAYYGRAVSGSAYPWCCVFVWWVFRQAGLEALLGGKTASCTALKNQLKQLGRSVDVRDMAPGDLVFYNWRSGAKSSTANHVGIVERVNADGSYIAIEGNTSLSSDDDGGKVMRRTREKSVVCAVARPDYKIMEDDSMNVCTAKIARKDIRAIRIVLGLGKTARELKAELGCDYVINGGLYDATGPVCQLKSDGAVLAKDQWKYIGYGWDSGADLHDLAVPEQGETVRHYIACVKVLGDGLVDGKPVYPKELGGKRGRSCIAYDGQDSLYLYCSMDGSDYAMTPEELGQEMAWRGAVSALMLDGGGSAQCDFGAEGAVDAERKVHNYLCVWTTRDIPGRYLVATKSDPLNVRKRPTVGGAKLGSLAKGTEADVLAVKDGWGRTVEGWVSMDYMAKVAETTPSVASGDSSPVMGSLSKNEASPSQLPRDGEPSNDSSPVMGSQGEGEPAAETPATPEQADSWAQSAWLKAYAGGILDGTRPRDAITRQEVAVILDRLGWLGGDV